jgi:ubiquinone/menaquinone biosynthesis C-methylase UbiE
MNSKSTVHKAVIQHTIFLFFAVLILGGIYFYFQTMTSLSMGAALLLLAHLVVAGGVVYLLRGFIIEAIQRMHGHSHENLETQGSVIRWANIYDLLVRMILLGGGEEKLRESIVKLAQIQPGESVLDVGCGTGTLAITAKRKSDATVKMYGSDASPEMIQKAREKAIKAGVQVDFQPGLVEAIDFPDNSLDVVLSSFMVHHLPGDLKQKAFAEIFRVLRSPDPSSGKPGGRLIIVDFEPPKSGVSRTFLRFLLGPGMMVIDNTKVPRMLEAAGFASIKTGNAGHKLATYISGQKA